jgi:hypothetical protein
VIERERSENPEVTSYSRIFVGISGLGVSTFMLTRSRALHIRSFKIVKREEIVEEHFGISAFRDSGTQGGSVLESRVLNSRFAKSREENHFGILVIRGSEGRGGREFKIEHYKPLVREIMSAIGSGEDHSCSSPWKWDISISVFQGSTYQEY